MAKTLEFYDYKTGRPYRTSQYVLRTTSNGRRQAVATRDGRKLYRFVKSDFKR